MILFATVILLKNYYSNDYNATMLRQYYNEMI